MRLTEPSEKDNWTPTRKYSLRGVVTSDHIVYICRAVEPDLIQLEDSPKPAEQWWKLGYDLRSDEPLIAEVGTWPPTHEMELRIETDTGYQKTTREKVIVAASENGDKMPLLIFASEEAVNEAPHPLSDALSRFVKHDNRLFKQELLEEIANPPAANGAGDWDKKRVSDGASPASPSKRQREGSIDSMATNRASLGDLSDRDPEDIPMTDAFLEDLEASRESGPYGGTAHGEGQQLGTEMVQLAISRPDDPNAGAAARSNEDLHDKDADGDVIADWDHPEGLPVVPAKIRRALNE
jgi:hypothetical protein